MSGDLGPAFCKINWPFLNQKFHLYPWRQSETMAVLLGNGHLPALANLHTVKGELASKIVKSENCADGQVARLAPNSLDIPGGLGHCQKKVQTDLP